MEWMEQQSNWVIKPTRDILKKREIPTNKGEQGVYIIDDIWRYLE